MSAMAMSAARTQVRQWGHPMNDFTRPSSIPFPSATELYFVLRVTPDGEFPGGKWATIQHLETLLDEAARDGLQAPAVGAPDR